MPRDFITALDVAQMIGLTDAAAFLQKRHHLQADHAFPLPMPTSARPLRWRADQVEAWVEAQGTPRAPALPVPQGSNIHLLHLARTA